MNQNRNNIDKLVIKNQNNHMRQPTNIDRIIARNMLLYKTPVQKFFKDEL